MSVDSTSSSRNNFAIAVALTQDHGLMACGFLAKVRLFHPNNDLFLVTNPPSVGVASAIADLFSAKELVVTDSMGFQCLEWGPIVTSKFRVFDLPTTDPVTFLDIDQVLSGPLDDFVQRFVDSGAIVAGANDDEPLANQFQVGKIPPGLDPEDRRVINTGAFITRPSRDLFELIRRAIPTYTQSVRLPTQGLINGVLRHNQLPFEVFGREFMIGPFDKRVLDVPPSAALIHLWTPRPPFMTPNPRRKGVDGELTWSMCADKFERENAVEYPFTFLRDLYMEQMALFEERYNSTSLEIERPDIHRKYYDAYRHSRSSSSVAFAANPFTQSH